MIPFFTRIVVTAALGVAAVSAQAESASQVAARAERVNFLVERLASGELSVVERAECKKLLLDLLREGGAARVGAARKRSVSAKERQLEGGDLDVIVEVVGEGAEGERRVRWLRDELEQVGEDDAPRRVQVRRSTSGPRNTEPSADVGREMTLRSHALEGARKAYERALRAHEEVMKEHQRVIEVHERQVHGRREAAPGTRGAQRSEAFEVDRARGMEGLEERIAAALQGVGEVVEVDYEVIYRDEHGRLGRAKARTREGDGRRVGVVLQGRGEPGRGTSWVVRRDGEGEPAVFEWIREEHDEHGHREHEHEERGRREHEHDERGRREHEHEEHSHREEAAAVVEELFKTVAEMREELRELREMLDELHHAMDERREAGRSREERRRGGRRRARRGR